MPLLCKSLHVNSLNQNTYITGLFEIDTQNIFQKKYLLRYILTNQSSFNSYIFKILLKFFYFGRVLLLIMWMEHRLIYIPD